MAGTWVARATGELRGQSAGGCLQEAAASGPGPDVGVVLARGGDRKDFPSRVHSKDVME